MRVKLTRGSWHTGAEGREAFQGTICVHISPPSSHQGHCALRLVLPWRLASVAVSARKTVSDDSITYAAEG